MLNMRRYIAELVGTPYIWWREGESTLDKLQPFYAKPDEEVPSVEEIHRLGTNCAGFINLICRRMGATIPGVSDNNYYAGGTDVWYEALKAQDKLQPIDQEKVYPVGTLLLSPYVSESDQGHVAIVTTEGTIETLKISNSFPTHGIVMDEPIAVTHNLTESGYYTATATVGDWLA